MLEGYSAEDVAIGELAVGLVDAYLRALAACDPGALRLAVSDLNGFIRLAGDTEAEMACALGLLTLLADRTAGNLPPRSVRPGSFYAIRQEVDGVSVEELEPEAAWSLRFVVAHANDDPAGALDMMIGYLANACCAEDYQVMLGEVWMHVSGIYMGTRDLPQLPPWRRWLR